MKVGLIVAMDSEYEQVLRLLGGKPDGTIGSNGTQVSLRLCGIGKVNAAIGTMHLINNDKPDCIISTGLAGGIGPDVEVWDAVVAAQTAYHDVYCGMGCEQGQVQGLPTRFDSSKPLVDLAMSIKLDSDDKTAFHKGLICTGDQFITSVEPVAAIRKSFPDALACDMESAAIAHVCHLMKMPFLSIRIISDTPDRVKEHALQWEQSLKVMTHRSFRIIDELLKIVPESI